MSTEVMVIEAFQTHNFICLIKLYREHTGSPLKESKEALEKAFSNMSISNKDIWNAYHLEKVLNLFFHSGDKKQEELKVAIDIIYSNWKNLGYPSFKAGVLAVMGNY